MPALSQHQSSQFTKLTRKTTLKEFWSKFVVDENNCHIWQGNRDDYGYGRLGKRLVTHIVWELSGRSRTPGLELCHICSSKACAFVGHLYEGTHKQNMEDAARAGIMRGNRKFDSELYARATALKEQGMLQKDIALVLGMSPANVSKFFKGGIRHAKS